ncbi:hypothetical protein U1Q18_039327 [Sarracenia purpurea var. burkii]
MIRSRSKVKSTTAKQVTNLKDDVGNRVHNNQFGILADLDSEHEGELLQASSAEASRSRISLRSPSGKIATSHVVSQLGTVGRTSCSPPTAAPQSQEEEDVGGRQMV